MSLVTAEGIAVHLESRSKSPVHEHESSNLLRPAFQKAIERAADKQAAADRATLKQIGINDTACHSSLEYGDVSTPAGELIPQTSASSALAHLNREVPQDHVSGASVVGELVARSSGLSASHAAIVAQCTDVPSLAQTPLIDSNSLKTPLNSSVESARANGISSASPQPDKSSSRSIDTQAFESVDGVNHLIASSELMASSQPMSSSVSASPVARGGIDQQTFDTLSHMLSRQNYLSDSEAQALTLKVIAGIPGVESLKVQQDEIGQWHLLLQLNPNSSRSKEEHKAELLAELSSRGHTMGSINISRQAGSALAEQEI